MVITFLVVCPQCRQQMKYVPMKLPLATKATKTCVYCGRSFRVRANIVRQAAA